MKTISFIQPSRNNLKYLKWSYNSIRKNLGYVHEICMADDFSTDGTWEWLQEIAETDSLFELINSKYTPGIGLWYSSLTYPINLLLFLDIKY